MTALNAGPARVELEGGTIRRLAVDGLDLLVPIEVDERDHGCFPMAPWAGRIRHGRFTFDGREHQLPINKPPHAIHGTVRDVRWDVRADGSSAVLRTELDDRWPFRGSVTQRLQLTDRSLRLELEVRTDDASMPASCGWHPWWSRELIRGEPVEVELRASRMYRRDDEGIPTGELVPITPPPWDDCFTDLGDPVAVLRWPDAITVSIATDCRCVVVFTEAEHAVCVEPQSGPPDEVNVEPNVVTPDAPLIVSTTWSWEPVTR